VRPDFTGAPGGNLPEPRVNTGSKQAGQLDAALSRAREFIAAGQTAEGGWGYASTAQPFAEPTAYALLALAGRGGEEGRAAREQRALAWLTTLSGSGPLAFAEQEAGKARAQQPADFDVWGTVVAFFALRRLDLGGELTGRYEKFLLSVRGNRIDEANSRLLKLDGGLQAWAWAMGTASWVEPTAYALLALKAHGLGAHERVKVGERFLLDRACYEGGWNYGNKEVLDVVLEPMPTVTAYALLALQDLDRTHEVITKSLRYLEAELAARQSSLALALGVLCFDAYARETERLVAGLLARQEADGSWRGNYHLTALAALALDAAAGRRNVFKL
jgi:hypothetical protein